MALPRLNVALAYLAGFYPRQTVTPALLHGYLAELSDLPVDDVEAAVRAIVRTSQWFPTVAELRAAAVRVRLALPTEDEALAQVEAYVSVVMRRRLVACGVCDGRGEVAVTPGYGPDGAIGCEPCRSTGEAWDVPLPALHPAVRAALDLIGGYRGYVEADEPSVVRGQFLRLYRSAATRATRDEQVGELPAGPLALPAALTPNLPDL